MIKLTAEPREVFGKKLSSHREAGKLPVVVYGPTEKPGSFFVSMADFVKVWRMAGESAVISLDVGKGRKEVLIHDVVFHPVSGNPVHADFYAIEKGKEIEVTVPIVFEGVAPAVKNLGGTLIKVLHEVEVRALPDALPQHITVGIEALETLESQILVKDIKLPTGVTVLNDGTEVVASISVAKEEEEVVAPAPDLSTIEVQKRGKKEEEGAEQPSADKQSGQHS